ncbi:MAG TPA: hypothetical protein VJN18_21420 [Polyangiaceae bacterium]|nr:hypothetical protein [Polyangiaceae bacterium]
MRNGAARGTTGARFAAEVLRHRLPPGWVVDLRPQKSGRDQLTLRAPDGRRASLTVVSRQRVLPRDVANLMAQPRGPAGRMLVAPFLSPRARELLAASNASYADETGNLRVIVEDPAVFVESQGADRDPERRPRPLQSLKGSAAARVVRALCDLSPPYGVRTLAERSTTPLGTVSRVVTFLEEEAVITRDEKKVITAVDWPALIKRWVADYGVTSSNLMRSYIEPRGLAALAPKLAKLGRYAATGSMAVAGGVAPARLAMIYVADAEEAAKALELVPTETGANVWLLEPYDAVVFERTQLVKIGSNASIVAAAPSQVVADLMTSPGRGPQEADALMERMKGTEDAWRQKP